MCEAAFLLIETSLALRMPTSSSAKHFRSKVERVNMSALGLKAYPEAYGNHILMHLDYYLSIYQQAIEQAVKAAGQPPSALSVLDFGCGNGFLGMYARHYGFKTVWLCDVAPDFLVAAQKTATAAAIDISGFICGDIKAVQDYFTTQGNKPDIVLSTDVIEHIYDLEALFRSLKQINPDLVSVFTTASNPYNYMKVKELRKAQQKDEYEGYSNLSRELLLEKGLSPLSFYEQRRKLIHEAFQELPEQTISELARRTRGKMRTDIMDSVSVYLKTGKMPDPPPDKHWVCDPYTGSWTERVLPVDAYREIAAQAGFTLSWVNGFYNAYSKGRMKSLFSKSINTFISATKALGKFLAPYIVLVFVPDKNKIKNVASNELK